MKAGNLLLIATLLVFNCCKKPGYSQVAVIPVSTSAMLQIIKQNLSNAGVQYKMMAKSFPAGSFPKSFAGNATVTVTAGDWCSGFYAGTLFNIYEDSKDDTLLNDARLSLSGLTAQQYNTGTHDLGFMLYNSYGNAYRITPQPGDKQILINAAKSLASRFSPVVGCIRSWNSDAADFDVIIDNMMNLELLFWATKATGDSSFYKIAVSHANTTMKNHFRPDYSSYHMVVYYPATGAVKQKKTVQGYSDASAWARGQAWGLYGFTMMYRETKDLKYLKLAENIARFILSNPNLPADKVPYWDFNDPKIPDTYRDASAGAVMASALLELSTYDSNAGQTYLQAAKTILQTLSGTGYQTAKGSTGGFLLLHSVGNLPGNAEIDVPLIYADYYFVEAMRRFEKIAPK